MVGPARVNAIAKYSVLSLMFVRFPAQWTLLLDPTAAWDLINSKWPSPTSRCEIIPSRPALWYRTSPYADNRFLVTNTPVRVYSGISWSTFFGGKGWLRDVLVYLAPTEAQHRSGTIEAHIRQIKQMLRSSCRRIRKQPIHPFNSIFDLDLLLVKISGLLNSRPIFSNEKGILSISDVLHPKITTGDQFEITESFL